VSPYKLGQQQQQQQEEWQERQQERQQENSAEVSVDWSRLSSQLSAAGFGHLALMQQQGEELTPELTSLHDTLCKVCGVMCGAWSVPGGANCGVRCWL
jgi:hypothetical protein